MMAIESKSIFKDFIVEELPNYALVSDDQLLEDCKWFLGIEISKNQVSSQIIDYVDSLGNEKDEVSEYLLCEIAQLYLETNKQDELINLLLNAEHSRFKKIINEVKQISGGIHYVENAAKKSILQELETKLEAEDFEIVLQRIERKDQKERLKELEEQFERENVYASFEYNLTGTEDHNLNYALDPEIKGVRNWKVIIRPYLNIASVLLLFIVKINDPLNETYTVRHLEKNIELGSESNKDELNNKEIFAGKLTNIDLPSASQSSVSKEYSFLDEPSGFVPNWEVKITLIQSNNQLAYIISKKKNITDYKEKIANKKFKNKKTTLDSLTTSLKTLDRLQASIISKDMTYEFDGTEVKLFTSKAKDLQTMKVFNYNERENETFYLYLDNAFYELKKGKGKLQILTDIDRIEMLEELRMNTP